MDETTKLIVSNILDAMKKANLTEAELSQKAGLNRRAFTDLREGRVKSPKVSTVFALCNALGIDPVSVLGLSEHERQPDALANELALWLADYSPEDRARFLAALTVLRPPKA